MSTRDKSILSLIELKYADARTLAGVSMTSFALFLAVNGALLAPIVGDRAMKAPSGLLSSIGIIGAMTYLLSAYYQNETRKAIRLDVEELLAQLSDPPITLASEQFVVIRQIACCEALFSVATLVGWGLIYLGI